MKRIAVSFLLLLVALSISAASFDELVKQAQSEYVKGNAAEALKTLGLALATNPTGSEAKRTLADAYTDIGVKEYDRKNYKNAYECFRNAVKLAPTNQLATNYFWKMKREMNVEKLKNEADEAAQKAPPVQVPGAAGTEGAAPAGGAAAKPAVDTADYRETLEKLSKTEQELENLRKTASQARDENAATRTELERQKREAEQQLEAIRKSTLSAAQESAALKTEIERQKALSEQEREEVRKATLAARDENMTLRSELGQYRVLIDQLKEQVQQTGQSAGRDTKALTELLTLYQQSLERQGSTDEEGTRYLAEQLAEQRKLLDLQFRAMSDRNLLLIAGFALLGVLMLFFLFLIVRAQLRRRRERRAGEPLAAYPSVALAAEAAQQARGRIAGGESLLLEFSREEGQPAGVEPVPGEPGMYRDLLRAERIKRMHDQMKQGTLKWETVRDYIGELEKDLRVEILKVIESKILEGDGIDPRAILQVLSPYLTDYDDYLRDKAESLVRTTLAAVPRGPALLPAFAEETPKETDDSTLGLRKLLELEEKLKKLLKDRERSVATAKIARGMARFLGFSPADSDLLYRSAIAHDAGYLMLDHDRLRRILGKPTLSAEDFRFIRSHARKGVEYFKGTQLPQPFKDAIIYHHERNDGSGYPNGLAGSKIPLFAKIIGVAETFVALTSARLYREKLSSEAALAVIRDGIGQKFDREHVDALVELIRRTGEVS